MHRIKLNSKLVLGHSNVAIETAARKTVYVSCFFGKNQSDLLAIFLFLFFQNQLVNKFPKLFILNFYNSTKKKRSKVKYKLMFFFCLNVTRVFLYGKI